MTMEELRKKIESDRNEINKMLMNKGIKDVITKEHWRGANVALGWVLEYIEEGDE